jgi:hypothetical protein
MRRFRQNLAILSMAVLGACAGQPRHTESALTLARAEEFSAAPVESFFYQGRYTGWDSLARDKLIVWINPDQAYLLTVEPICEHLQFANRLGLTSTGTVVNRGFDSILLEGHERCKILEIRPVDLKRLNPAQYAKQGPGGAAP